MRSADGRFEYLDLGDEPVPEGTAPQDVHRFAFVCRRSKPAAAGDKPTFCSLNLRGRGHDVENKSWTWDGNIDRPTLAPSINCQNDQCWHGYIENGVYLTCQKTPEPKQ